MFSNPWVDNSVLKPSDMYQHITRMLVFFTVLPIRLKTCKSINFLFLQGQMCELKKSGTTLRFCAPEFCAPIAIGCAILQACICLTFTFWGHLKTAHHFMHDLWWPLESKGQRYSRKRKQDLLFSFVKMFKILQIFLSLIIP